MVEGMLGQQLGPAAGPHARVPRRHGRRLHVSPAPAEDPPRVLAALGPKMLELAAARAWGAHTYFVPVEHTPVAREHLGEGPMLLVELGGRAVRRPRGGPRGGPQAHGASTSRCPTTPTTCAASAGATTTSADGGSDRLVDAIVAWGDVDASPTGCRRTTRPAPTTSASRCSTPTSPRCRSTSGASWRPRCSRPDLAARRAVPAPHHDWWSHPTPRGGTFLAHGARGGIAEADAGPPRYAWWWRRAEWRRSWSPGARTPTTPPTA